MGVDVSVPDGLGPAGERVWRAVVADLPEGQEFAAHELLILEAAARQADTVAELEAVIAQDGLMIQGAAGQRRLNAAVTELRQGRIAFSRLLGDLGIELEE